jgi:hypothetical protein
MRYLIFCLLMMALIYAATVEAADCGKPSNIKQLQALSAVLKPQPTVIIGALK